MCRARSYAELNGVLSSYFVCLWRATSQVMIVTMIVVMIKVCVSSSIGNYKLTSTTFCNVDLTDHAILNNQVALKVATLHKIKDPLSLIHI